MVLARTAETATKKTPILFKNHKEAALCAGGKQEKNEGKQKNCWLNILLLNGKVHFLRSVEKAPQNWCSASKLSLIDSSLLLVENGYSAAQISRMEMSQLRYWIWCNILSSGPCESYMNYVYVVKNSKNMTTPLIAIHTSCLQHTNAIYYTLSTQAQGQK